MGWSSSILIIWPYLAPFVKIDKLEYKEVKQALQSFVYGVNTPSR